MKQNNAEEFPFVSLLVAMRNEEGFIGSCLQSILMQDYPADRFEAIVLDGVSTDQSKEIVNKLIGYNSQIKLMDNPGRYQAIAWNLGITQARGDIVGIVSAHAELAPDYITNLVETLKRTKAELVGGPTHADSKGYVAEVIAISLNSRFGVGDALFHYTTSEVEVDTVFMGTCWRKTYEKIGGFDKEMVRDQDDEFSYRLLENGGRIICNPKIKSRYFSRPTLKGLFSQYFQYGLYKVRVLQKHPNQMRLRQFVPFLFVGALLLLLILSLFTSFGIFILGLIVGAYLVVNLAASMSVSADKGWRYLPLLPVVYSILHISYGLGFFAGLAKFWNRWRDKNGQVPEIPPLNHDRFFYDGRL